MVLLLLSVLIINDPSPEKCASDSRKQARLHGLLISINSLRPRIF